jgi:hypothetical protein
MTPHCYLIDALNQVLSWDISVEDCPEEIQRQAALIAGLSQDELEDSHS